MASYCNQCSEELFGSKTGDFAGLLSDEHYDLGRVGAALCEGCGPVAVDPEGNCVSLHCLRSHNKFELAPVVSANMVAVGYYRPFKTLRVEFKGGLQYNYLDVPEDVFLDLMESESKGEFLATQIKGKYQFEKHINDPVGEVVK